MLTNLTFVILTVLVAPFGTEATAGYGAAGRLEYLLIPVVFGVGSALVPLVAASDGAGDIGRVRRLTRAGAALGAGACGLVGFTAALFPSAWMALFTSDPAVAGRTWSGSARPTPSSGWGWPCISPRRGVGGRRSRSWPP
ncbi:MAG: MATE family efflux transporter [Isosphaeraceae bacterium]